ncbi:hypothetical protein [Nonomuraea salmonea]
MEALGELAGELRVVLLEVGGGVVRSGVLGGCAACCWYAGAAGSPRSW